MAPTPFARKGKDPVLRRIGIAVAAAALLLVAAAPAAHAKDTRQSTALEFDRMTGTEYPTAQKRKGTTSDLASIYASGGVDLAIDYDDQDIPPLTGDNGEPVECITNAELDALAESYRGSPVPPGDCNEGGEHCIVSYAYGVVVDHYAANGPDDCRTGVLGRMWDTEQRSSFAIYYATNTISTNGQKYLRTTAHELGHAFNLHHEDGDGETTIMNQTSVVGDNFTYTWSEHSASHLEHHVDPCNVPGSGVFYGVDEQHAGWHSGTEVDCADGVYVGGGNDDADAAAADAEEEPP